MSKEIGGYLSFHYDQSGEYLKSYTLLNSGRSAFSVILKLLKVRQIYLPYYTCPVVWETCKKNNIEIIGYDISESFIPELELDNDSIYGDSYILCTNYFGINSNAIKKVCNVMDNVIIDNAQAFYADNYGKYSFYSPRKFFPLPDGGLIKPKISTFNFLNELERSESWKNCSHILCRTDKSALSGYKMFLDNENFISEENEKKMSLLTKAWLSNINFSAVKYKRRQNFELLHNHLGNTNRLNISLELNDVPLGYPYLTDNEFLRNKLIKNKIFVPYYWKPNSNSYAMHSNKAMHFADSLLCLPIDQRYSKDDMLKIIEVIHENN